MINQRRRTPLNTLDPRVGVLSGKYNLTPKTVAYIRAAIGSKRYTKESLVEHIEFENKGRLEAVERHKISEQLSQQDKENLVHYTEINIQFREGVVEILSRLSSEELLDICN